MEENKRNIKNKNKKDYPNPKMLMDLAEKSTSIAEFKKYENMFFDAMVLFAHEKNEKGEEDYSFYPAYACGLMEHCLSGKCAFSAEFDYKKFFQSLLASDNKCHIGQTIYLYKYLSLGNTFSNQELSEEEKEAFNKRTQKFFDAFDPVAFLDKCDKLKLVGPACSEEDYSFLLSSVNANEL